MKSQATKKAIKKRNTFFIISLGLLITTVLVLVFSVLKTVAKEPTTVDEATIELLSEQAKALILSISTTAVIGVIASFIIKDKLRTFIWITCVVMSAVIYKDTGMYIVLGVWLIDEYIIYALYKHYANIATINGVIDQRG